MTRTQEFIDKNRKILTSGPDFYNPDTSLMSIDDYHKAKCRMLVIFPTPHVVKTVSSTAAALNDFIITHCKDTFIDFAYMPENEDIKRYDDWNVPYAIGNITHLDPSHFDIVGFSISVLHEVVSGPSILSTFDRCDKPIPLFWSQRKDMPIGSVPLIYAGGITAACGESMFGKVNVNGKVEQGYMDFVYLGDCGHTHHITNRLIEALETGKCHRNQSDHDVPGYPHKDIDNFDEVCNINTMQDFVDSLFDMQEVYQPQAYDVEYNKHNRIIKNIKINPKAQDFVKPYYPHEMEPDLGIGRTIINASGDNCGTTQTQCSEGCSAGGHCNFCSEGVYTGGWVEKSHEQIIKESWEAKKYSAGYKYKPYSFNCVAVGTLVPTHKGLQYVENLKENQDILSVVDWTSHKGIHSSIQPTLSLYLSQGPGLQLTLQHRQTVLTSEGLTEVKAEELEAGMWIPQRIGYYSVEKADVTSTSYLLGLWYGDGYYSGNSTYVLVDQNDMELNEIVKTHEYCQRLVRTEGNLNVYILSKEFTKYCKAICPYKDIFRLCGNLNIQQSLEFIRGLFDADGCGSGGFLKITQKESRVNLLKEIQVILMSVGIRTRMSLPTKVTINGVEHTRRDVYVVGRESRDKFVNIIGSAEARKTKCVKTKSTKWSDKDKCMPPIFGLWVYNELKKIDAHKGHNVSKFFHGLKGLTVDRFLELFGSYDIEPVQLVKAGIRFAQVLSIEDTGECEVVDVMETTNGRWIANGYVTHNCNYLTDYKGMLAKWIQIYPKVTFINMRMEELGRDTDAMKIMKAVGSNRLSAPLEGLSPRIQNNMLNKCLSKESTNAFMEEVVHQHLTDLKVGGIFTSYEQDEDFQYICDFVDSFKKKAAAEGGSFPFRLKMTPLVHYALTPLEYLERKSARNSFNGEHWLTDEWYEKFREHDVHFKVNGFKYSTYLEQSFIDLGRSITDMIYRHFIKGHVKVYSLRSCATDDYLAELRSITDPDGLFGDRDPEHYISPCHRIHVDLMGSYIPRARRILRFKQQGDIFKNEPDIRCLKTFDEAKTKCYHNCIKNDPLMLYNDVTMDEDGNLHGQSYPLYGCERCQTPKQRLARLKRPTPQTKNCDDIIATPRIPQVQKVRFVLKRKSEYDVLNPNNTAHTFMTKFLQLSDNLLHSYHSIVCHNMLWQSAPAFKDYVYGYQIVDTMWSKNSIKEIKELIPEVNKHLKSVQVVSAQEILRDEKLLITDYNTWVFESELPKEQFDGAAHSYKGQIKVEAQVQGFALTETTDSNLMSPVYQQIGGKVYGAFTIPAKYNPVMYLMGYVSQSKKTSEDAIVTSTQFQCITASRETKMPCRNCSEENAMISLITGKPLPFGKKCLSKVVLGQLIKNMN